MYTRLYYALTPDEAADLIRARADFDAHGCTVRSLIYDSLLAEGVEESLLTKHNLVEKKLQRWQDLFFMLVRAASRKRVGVVRKVATCKKMCILNSCLNVGSTKVQKAVASFTRSGPHSYMRLQQHLAAMKTGQYLQESNLEALSFAAHNTACIVGAQGHCVGIKTTFKHSLQIFDDAYGDMIEISITEFTLIPNQFILDHPQEEVLVFILESGTYRPRPHPACFQCVAGAAKKLKFRMYARPTKLNKERFSLAWKRTPYVRHG